MPIGTIGRANRHGDSNASRSPCTNRFRRSPSGSSSITYQCLTPPAVERFRLLEAGEVPLRKLLIIRRWPVNRRNRLIVEPQIHGQLAPMMGEVVERVAKN